MNPSDKPRIYPPANPFPMSADDSRIAARIDERTKFVAECEVIESRMYSEMLAAANRAEF